ncbi:MAG: type I-F CRISPR-associated endoribonuclease Cas6/Csy4 [Pseudohongiellaceae bacterium]
MDHYVDLKLLPDPEFPAPMLMNALFSKLHRALVEMHSNTIGVSFPELQPDQPSLGRCLRAHGTERDLAQLMQKNWLAGMRDHITQQKVAKVPDEIQHRRIKRVQSKSSAERLRRRHAKRHPELSETELLNRIPDFVEQQLDLPFIRIQSGSSGQQFRLFLEHLPVQKEPVKGKFNSYGLSTEATIPWF